MAVVFVQIGNSDDRLTQAEYAAFIRDLNAVIPPAGEVIGVWYSAPDSPWQNACWMFRLDSDESRLTIRALIMALAERYRQQAIAWTEAPSTEFLGPDGPTDY